MVVSDDPVDYTPQVLDGSVESIVQVGERIVVAGDFQQVKEQGAQKPVLDQPYIFAFDPDSGAIDESFLPTLDGDVRVVLPAPDGQSVYAGGTFDTVNGALSRKLTRLDIQTGEVTAGFAPSAFHARIVDLRLIGAELLVAGRFGSVGGQERSGLASVNAETGAVTPFLAPALADPRRGDRPFALKLDVTPDLSRLIVIGNFATVDGESRPQLAVFDTTGPTAALTAWRSPFFDVSKCSTSFETYMRDLDIDPTGQFFVVTTTGSFGGPTSPCDVEVRFELGAVGSDIQPTWRAYTGGDTAYAVEITPAAVYVGGHFRWFNNPYGQDSAGPGAIPRGAIAALDPRNGMPLSWNPTRTAGVGVFDFLATDRGLYLGSDTDIVANEWHPRLALFPTGAQPLPAEVTGELPADVYLLGRTGGGDDVRRYFVDGNGDPSYPEVLDGPEAWGSVRGSFMVDNTLYTGWADGTFKRRSFNGTSYGAVSDIDLYGGYFGGEVSNVTGMFYDKSDARMYFTLAGSDALHWRAFLPESDAVGAFLYEASGETSALNPSTVGSMFLSGDRLYFVDKTDGNLYSVGFVRGTVEGPRQLVDDSVDWLARGAFVFTQPNRPPSAAFSASVDGLSVSVDGGQSVDADGSVVQWAWDFGDGETAVGKVPAAHVYAAAGSYTVSLTVTDDEGATASASRRVQVDDPVVDQGWSVLRLAGQDRYLTAVAVSRDSFDPGVSAVYVASGENFPDALSAGPAAGRSGGPLLLVQRDAVPAGVLAELRRLDPDRIVVVGGAGVVSASVESQLRPLAPTVRLAGANRYATSAAVSAASYPGGADVAYLATGASYADALSAGPVAARRGAPLLLTSSGGLSAETAAELRRLGVDSVVIAGGTGAVSRSVEQSLRGLGYSVARVAGADRYATAAALSRSVFGDRSVETAFLATGLNYPDALGAGAAAALRGVPMLLSGRQCMPSVTTDELSRLGAGTVRVSGGTAVVSEAAARGSTC